MNFTELYRPVGQREFERIAATGFRRFPERLPAQHFFYPVLNEEYATQIARDWNAKDPDSGCRGYVLRFRVRSEFLSRYEVRTVGSAVHREYWIPAEELNDFNENIDGEIEVVAQFEGEQSRNG